MASGTTRSKYVVFCVCFARPTKQKNRQIVTKAVSNKKSLASTMCSQNFHKLLDREIVMQAMFENGMVLLTTNSWTARLWLCKRCSQDFHKVLDREIVMQAVFENGMVTVGLRDCASASGVHKSFTNC